MSYLINSEDFAIILLVISSLPILNKVQLPDISSGREFSMATKEFVPVQGIAETIVKYAGALVSDLDGLIKKRNGEDRTIARPNGWSYYRGKKNIQYYVADTPNYREYGIKTIAPNNEIEKFTVNSTGLAQWKRDGSLPLSVKFNPETFSETDAQLRVKEGDLLSSNNPLLDLLEKKRFAPQRVARTMINEAKTLIEIAEAFEGSKGKKEIKDARIFIRRTEHSYTYILKQKYKALIVEVNRANGEIEKIAKTQARSSYDLILKADNLGTSKIAEEATLEIKRKNKEKLSDVLKSLDLNLTNELYFYPVGTKRIVNPDKAKIDREKLLAEPNLTTILDRTGIIYNNGNYPALTQFLKYTKMPPGSISFAFADSVNNCPLININNKPIKLERFGDSELRGQAIGYSDAGIRNIDDFKKYLQGIGVKVVCNQDIDNAIYRWGIKQAAAKLRRVGIFYVAAKSSGQKEKIYLVDIGRNDNWGSTRITKIRGNQKKDIALEIYPNQRILLKIFPELKLGPGINIQMKKASHLKKMFESIGFEVANAAETEDFIKTNAAAQRFVSKRLDAAQENKASRAKYVTLVGSSIAQALLAKDHFTIDQEVQDPKSPMAKPWLLFHNGTEDQKLGFVSISNADRTSTIKNIKEHAQQLSKNGKVVKPVEIKIENLDLRNRTANLKITELAA